MICEYCKKEIDEDSLFCTSCGRKVEKYNKKLGNIYLIILLINCIFFAFPIGLFTIIAPSLILVFVVSFAIVKKHIEINNLISLISFESLFLVGNLLMYLI